MSVAAPVIALLTVVGWVVVFVPPRDGIWVRTWVVAAILVAGSVAALGRAGELGDAVGPADLAAVGSGLAVGVVWLVATQIGHRVLCRLLPSFIEQVRDLYSLASGDSRRDVLVALIGMAVAEEFVFRLVLQRQYGVVVAVVAYGAVQLVERNWALVLAGAACGAVWGALYWWQDSLAATLVAHVVWTGTLTFLWPLRGCDGNRVPEADGVAITESA